MISPLFPTYSRIDLAFESGSGAWLLGSDGRSYLDFGGGIAVCSLGYEHPHVTAALIAQVRQLGNYGAVRKYEYAVRGVNSRLDPIQASILLQKLPDPRADRVQSKIHTGFQVKENRFSLKFLKQHVILDFYTGI